MQSLFSTDKVIDIALDDVNIDILNNSSKHLTSNLLQYELMVTEPTNIIGSLIEHVYVSNYDLQKLRVEKNEAISIYFSDHDAIKFKLSQR